MTLLEIERRSEGVMVVGTEAIDLGGEAQEAEMDLEEGGRVVELPLVLYRRAVLMCRGFHQKFRSSSRAYQITQRFLK